MERIIKNFDELATTELRHHGLTIAEAGYSAIDTESVVRNNLTLNGSMLTIAGVSYDLSKFASVRVIGFGKASCKATQTIELILRDRVREGYAIDVKSGVCDIIQVSQGSHPYPSKENVAHTKHIVGMAGDIGAEDLVITVVSGGGSSLLCWPMDECEQGGRLYDDFMRVGAPIDELNLVRRHISEVKGGGLAAMLHPATVVALIFCDVPGDGFHDVASGPTYYDESTIEDAQNILDKYGFVGYTLRETPKDHTLFKKVRNVPMVSNQIALTSMQKKAEELGYAVLRIGDALYDEPASLVEKLCAPVVATSAVMAGGESRIVVSGSGSQGGRCQYVSLTALKHMTDDEIFISIASDGVDNSEAAGAITDMGTIKRALAAGLDIDAHLRDFNTFPLLRTTGDLFYTGPTDANVSDLYMFMRKVW